MYASDTGAALRRNSIDVFIGYKRMAPHARRLGVQHWKVALCAPVVEPAAASAPTPETTVLATR